MWNEHFVVIDNNKTRNDEAPKGIDKGRHALFSGMREAYPVPTKCILSREEYFETTSPLQINLIWIFDEPSA